MKKNLFLYLFIFALLINVFTYMYFTNKQKFEDGRIDEMQAKVKSLKDSLETVTGKCADANYFSVESNSNALNTFTGDINEIAIKIRDGILAKNDVEKGNSLVPYPPIEGKPFIISKLKVLNDRWVIADFSNTLNEGQVLIKYFIEDDGSITYETAETVFYSEY